MTSKEATAKAKASAKSRFPSGMTTKEATAKATATSTAKKQMPLRASGAGGNDKPKKKQKKGRLGEGGLSCC